MNPTLAVGVLGHTIHPGNPDFRVCALLVAGEAGAWLSELALLVFLIREQHPANSK